MTTGQRMRTRRKELNLSADDVAKALGVSRSTIFRYEKGDIEKLPIDILQPLSTILQTTPAYLMGWNDFKHEDLDDDLDNIETELKFCATFDIIMKSFGYEVEYDFGTDEDGDETILFENESEAFEIKQDLYLEFKQNVFSFIDFGISKLISDENRVKSNDFVEVFEKKDSLAFLIRKAVKHYLENDDTKPVKSTQQKNKSNDVQNNNDGSNS